MLKKIRTWILLLVTTFFSFGQSKDLKLDPEARNLNDSAVNLARSGDRTSAFQAISLWDRAITIQPGYYTAHWNKMVLQQQIGLTEDAINTIKKLEQLRPSSPDLKMFKGIFLANRGDNFAAMRSFASADSLFLIVLDSSNVNTIQRQSTKMNRAVTLRLMGKDKEADELFLSILNEESDLKTKTIIDMVAKRKRAELLQTFRP